MGLQKYKKEKHVIFQNKNIFENSFLIHGYPLKTARTHLITKEPKESLETRIEHSIQKKEKRKAVLQLLNY